MRVLAAVAVLSLWLGVANTLNIKPVFIFPNFPLTFGDITDQAVTKFFQDKCVEAAGRNPRTEVVYRYSHPKACNVYIECVYHKVLWVVYGRIASSGNMFDARRNRQIETLTRGQANLAACPAGEHPCVNNQRIPQSNHRCEGYQICRNNQMLTVKCPNGTGYNTWTRQCDFICDRLALSTVRRILKGATVCRNSSKGNGYYEIRESVVYGKKQPVIETTIAQCPAATTYQVEGKCACQRSKETAVECTKINSLHLSSSDGTWELSKERSPLKGSSTISGTAAVVDALNNNYARSGFFNGSTYFSAYGLTGNDLGLYMDIAFTFQSVHNGNRGFTIPPGAASPYPVALMDNSMNDAEPTFGCMLNVVRGDRGTVTCFVRPSILTDEVDVDVSVTSAEVDLRRRVSVLFAKDNTRGRLTVTAEGFPEANQEFSFKSGVRALGNSSPFVIGIGKDKNPFMGYFDDVYIRKYCGQFL